MIFHKISFLFLFLIISSCVTQERTELVFDDKNSPGRSIASEESYPLKMQVSSRKYVLSVLMQVFQIEEGSTEWNQLTNDIYKKVEFGGGCDIYAVSDLDEYTLEYPQEACGSITTTQESTSNPMRYSLSLKSCEYLLARTNPLNAIRNKVSENSTWPEVSFSNIEKLWQEFYPLEELSSEVYESLENVAKAGSDSQEAWKLISFTICSSPGWQIY